MSRIDPRYTPAMSAARIELALGAIVLGALALGCAEEAAPASTQPEPEAPTPPEPDAAETDEEYIDTELAALGYVDYTDEPEVEEARAAGADAEALDELIEQHQTGLVARDADASWPGYTLITAVPQGRALLVDPAGEIVREWTSPHDAQWKRAALASNGDLLIVGARKITLPTGEKLPGAKRYVARWSPAGETLWQHDMGAHHDITEMPDGRLLTLTNERREIDGTTIFDDFLVVLSPEGEVLREHSLHDVLAPLAGEVDLSIDPKFGQDAYHANSIRLLDSGSEALHVVVSAKHINLVAGIDVDESRALWHFGQGELELQHEATEPESGNILVFDNGTLERGYSRVVEFDPRSGEIVWEYRADPPESFFSPARSTAQRLPNGNTLAANSSLGEVIEVTPEGRVVWHFRVRGENARRTAVRATRYPAEIAERALAAD